MAPLWRLPRAAYASAVSAGMFSTGEASSLAAFYSSVDQLNRGLDAVAAAVQRGDDRANEEHGRNRIKAMRLVHNGEHYAMANGTLTSRAV